MDDIMIDLETLSTATNAAILTIGAVRFNPYGDETTTPEMIEFYYKIDLDSCEELDLDIDENTINWWARQCTEAKDEAFSEHNRIKLEEVFKELSKFCKGAKRIWSNGAGFDVVICETIFKRLCLPIPWKFWNIRDCRTYYDLGIDPKMPSITAHNALADAKAQAIAIQNVSRIMKYASFKPLQKNS
jgi:DNA polymerase III epsilon subunit-like protein